MVDLNSLDLVQVEGMTHRLIPSKFPVIGLYDSISAPDDLEATMEIEARNNPRVMHELDTLRRLPREQWVLGPGATPLMAAICNPNPEGSRFADHSFGVYYAGSSIDTSQLECIFHTERVYRTSVPGVDPCILVKRLYQATIAVPLPSIRRDRHPELLDPNIATYPATQAFARALRASGAPGIHYPSVRDPSGFCVGIFDPRAVTLPVVSAAHYQFYWDGNRVTHVAEIANPAAVAPN